MERLTYRDPQTGKIYLYSNDADVIGRLADLEDLEEQGLLLRLPAPLDGVESFSLDGKDTWLRLPCKVGDKVYQIHTLPKSNRKVLVEAIADEFFITLCTLEKRFGKTVFLTQEEAEAALEKMKEGENGLD